MFKFLLVLLLCSFGLFGRATAAEDDLFAISAQFTDGAEIAGTITVDTNSGMVVAAHVLLKDDPNIGSRALVFDRVVREYSDGIAFITELAPDTGSSPVFIFGERNNPGSMRGYAGGPLGPRTDIKFDSGFAESIDHGYLTPLKASATPMRNSVRPV